VLGSKAQFNSQFGKAIQKGIKRSANPAEIALGNRAQQSLRDSLKDFMLRREKSLIADQMPKKEDVILTCPMTALQEKLYRNVLDSEDGQRLLNIKKPCQCGSRNPHGECCGRVNSKGQSVSQVMFKIFSALVKIANHVDLIKVDPIAPGRDKMAWQEDLEMARVAFGSDDMQKLVDDNRFLRKSDDSCSAKMKVLASLLRVWLKKNNKILVFSGSTKLLDIVEQMLIRIGTEYSRLDGGTPIKLRSSICKEFNSGNVIPGLFCDVCVSQAQPSACIMLACVTGQARDDAVDKGWRPGAESNRRLHPGGCYCYYYCYYLLFNRRKHRGGHRSKLESQVFLSS
jgi:SNF2 family DNA or RNA helicase